MISSPPHPPGRVQVPLENLGGEPLGPRPVGGGVVRGQGGHDVEGGEDRSIAPVRAGLVEEGLSGE